MSVNAVPPFTVIEHQPRTLMMVRVNVVGVGASGAPPVVGASGAAAGGGSAAAAGGASAVAAGGASAAAAGGASAAFGRASAPATAPSTVGAGGASTALLLELLLQPRRSESMKNPVFGIAASFDHRN